MSHKLDLEKLFKNLRKIAISSVLPQQENDEDVKSNYDEKIKIEINSEETYDTEVNPEENVSPENNKIPTNANKDRDSSKDEIGDTEIGPDEQWERVNILLIIICTILILNATSLAIYAWPVLKSPEVITILKTLYKDTEITIGFPKLHLALVSSEGIIKDFSIDAPKNEDFPKLPKYFYDAHTLGHPPFAQELYAVSKGDIIYYLSGSPYALVTKHFVDQGAKSHERIPNSKIPNSHFGQGIQTLQMGQFFWILGGYQLPIEGDSRFVFDLQYNSTIWSLYRESWIVGPELPFLLGFGSYCATALNSTVALFYSIEMMAFVSYDFSRQKWESWPSTLAFHTGYCSLATTFTKESKMQVSMIASSDIFTKTLGKYDVTSKEWLDVRNISITFLNSDNGRLINLRGNLFYFHGEDSFNIKMAPIYQVFDNGTLHQLEDEDIPFETEYIENVIDRGNFINYKLSPYYRRSKKTIKVAI